MSARKSIHIDGLSHLTAIPVATRIGPLLISSVIAPFDPGTRQVPEGYRGADTRTSFATSARC